MNPSFNYEVVLFEDASKIPESRRAGIIDVMNNELISTNWHVDRPHYSNEFHPFHESFSMAFLKHDGNIIGYTIYKLFQFKGLNVVYRFASEIRADHHGKGGYGLLTGRVMEHVFNHYTDKKAVYYAWRTRNPIVWAASANLCVELVPNIFSAMPVSDRLKCIALDLAEFVYPGVEVEPDTMAMRSVYGHLRYRRPTSFRGDSRVREFFEHVIPNVEDALFSVGVLRTQFLDSVHTKGQP